MHDLRLVPVQAIINAARSMGGAVHGDDADGWVDIEWHAGWIFDAASFARHARRSGWPIKLRDPITSLTGPVVLQVQGMHDNGDYRA